MRSLNLISSNSLIRVQHEWEIWLRSNPVISWIKIHPLTRFCFYPVVFLLNISPLKLFILIWHPMDHFLYSKRNSNFITVSKIILMTILFIQCVKWQWGNDTHCDVIMDRWHCLVNHMISPGVGVIAINTKQSCDQQPGSFTQDPVKTWIDFIRCGHFTLKLNLTTHNRIIRTDVWPVCY